jgi:alpha-galactosidase
MSRRFHRAYRTRLCRGFHRDRERPVLVNNWEATYFDFDENKILALADEARSAGIELLVLDDGWFGRRDNDRSSLGDWIVHRAKLPRGLKSLAEGIQKRGLQFGLWFEPEMISPDSDLYRAHPDWCLHVPGRPRTESRHQLVLDLTRADVRGHIVRSVSAILSSVPNSYVKWDMNRHYTEVGSALLPPANQKETFHRYILGLYEILDTITKAFPQVLFESCSGGGGRFDPGLLAYMPQTWTSDNTDAVSRLKIQYGTSLVYPPVTMGSHVSAVPNHQIGRTTSMSYRGAVAMGGNLGYELDLGRLTDEEKRAVKDQVAAYKRLRSLVQFGDFYRLADPFATTAAAWMFVSDDRALAWATYFATWIEANRSVPVVKLKGLDPEARYRWVDTDRVFGGDELMRVGLRTYGITADCQSCSWLLEKVP